MNDIDIEDKVVSIDAISTQREIAELIVDKKGHYLLALKPIKRVYLKIWNVLSR